MDSLELNRIKEEEITLDNKELYDRQKSITTFNPSRHLSVVIGCGGIGSWVAMDLALLGVGTIVLYDDDVIEITNLNRTLFRQSDIGRLKVDALTELIAERRKDITVIAHAEKFNVLKNISEYTGTIAVSVFDCTDTTRVKDLIKQQNESATKNNQVVRRYCKLGYDGTEMSMDINDFSGGAFGDDSSYTVVPSYFAAPQFISALAVNEMLVSPGYKMSRHNMNLNNILPTIKVGERVHETVNKVQDEMGRYAIRVSNEDCMDLLEFVLSHTMNTNLGPCFFIDGNPDKPYFPMVNIIKQIESSPSTVDIYEQAVARSVSSHWNLFIERHDRIQRENQTAEQATDREHDFEIVNDMTPDVDHSYSVPNMTSEELGRVLSGLGEPLARRRSLGQRETLAAPDSVHPISQNESETSAGEEGDLFTHDNIRR